MSNTGNQGYDHSPHHASLEPGNRRGGRRETSTIVWGASLVFVGLVFLLDRLEIIDRDLMHDWWPVALLLLGIFSRGHVLTAIGAWLLIGKLEIFGLTYSTSWPVILMIIGAGIVTDAFRTDDKRRCGTFESRGDGR